MVYFCNSLKCIDSCPVLVTDSSDSNLVAKVDVIRHDLSPIATYTARTQDLDYVDLNVGDVVVSLYCRHAEVCRYADNNLTESSDI